MLRRSLRITRATLPLGFRQLLGGSFWLVLAAGLGQGSMLIAGILVANTLGVMDYGRYALLQMTVMLLAGLAQLSFSVVISQQVAKLRNSDPQAASRIAGFCFAVTAMLGGLLALVLIGGRTFLSEQVFRDNTLTSGIAILAIALPFIATSAVQQGMLNGLERFREQTIVSLVLAPLVVLAPFLGARSYGLVGGMAGLVVIYSFRFVLTQLILIRIFRAENLSWAFNISLSRIRSLLSYAVPATIAGIVVWLAIWGGQTLLARQEGSGADLGLFNASYMIRTLVIFIPQQMALALLPLMTRTAVAGAAGGSQSLMRTSAWTVLGLSMLVAGIAALLAENLLHLFGEGFLEAQPILLLLLLSAPIESVTWTLYQSLQSQGRFWKGLAWHSAPLAFSVLGAAIIFVPEYLAIGLAGAWLLGWTISLPLILFAIRSAARRRNADHREEDPALLPDEPNG
tara:strand:+ start:12291 stop:13658 length:1368 start_codon:yes stop_codon:yes gene_type:complete